jgi:hypothetical protein
MGTELKVLRFVAVAIFFFAILLYPAKSLRSR